MSLIPDSILPVISLPGKGRHCHCGSYCPPPSPCDWSQSYFWGTSEREPVGWLDEFHKRLLTNHIILINGGVNLIYLVVREWLLQWGDRVKTRHPSTDPPSVVSNPLRASPPTIPTGAPGGGCRSGGALVASPRWRGFALGRSKVG